MLPNPRIFFIFFKHRALIYRVPNSTFFRQMFQPPQMMLGGLSELCTFEQSFAAVQSLFWELEYFSSRHGASVMSGLIPPFE